MTSPTEPPDQADETEGVDHLDSDPVGVTYPVIDAEAVARLRTRVGAAQNQANLEDTPLQSAPAGTARIKAQARRVATPVVARVRSELDRATAGEVAALRAELAELRAEVTRLRAEQEAALAAQREDRR
ncbi:MAG: hypothetical protein IPG97_01255 [Microthrixaceae bacterium]|jgi:hypothetical protein|nr:hypothetical protein [Microthrixaceae bacterium]